MAYALPQAAEAVHRQCCGHAPGGLGRQGSWAGTSACQAVEPSWQSTLDRASGCCSTSLVMMHCPELGPGIQINMRIFNQHAGCMGCCTPELRGGIHAAWHAGLGKYGAYASSSYGTTARGQPPFIHALPNGRQRPDQPNCRTTPEGDAWAVTGTTSDTGDFLQNRAAYANTQLGKGGGASLW